jgi:hypothetical protein
MITFEQQKNRKALSYTLLICAAILLLSILISWQVKPPTPAIIQDLIEINLGNAEEGWGEDQPQVKGSRSPYREESQDKRSDNAGSTPEKADPDDNAEEDAAPVTKVTKANPKSKDDNPDDKRENRSRQPKLTYNGPNNQNGNDANEDNGYRYQGNNRNSNGDAGSSDGNKDSYGKDQGGRVGGGVTITKGNRKIVKSYSFTDELDRATVYAIVKVSPEGRGTLVSLDKRSSSFNASYKNAIINHLSKIVFDKADRESMVTIRFNFNVN